MKTRATKTRVAVLGLLLTLGCSQRDDGSIRDRQRVGPPNVFLLVLDTTRADAIGATVDGRAVTPALDRLAGEGKVFTGARSTSAWTVPSHGSLFTGLFPSRHGAHHEHRHLDQARVTVAELLSSTHQTAGFSENPHIIERRGFTQGFEHFEVTHLKRGKPKTLELVVSWLRDRDPQRPFFLFVNLITPHMPYDPPARFRERFLPATAAVEEISRLRRFGGRRAQLYMSGALELTDRELELLRGLYLADVAYADQRASRLVEALAAAGELDDTLVVVVGDHGENIGEHGLMDHQLCLYETLLRVPMILRLPGTIPAGQVDPSPVQLVDVMPTILEAVGTPTDQWPEIEGHSLLRHSPPPTRPVFAEYMRPEAQRGLFRKHVPDFDFAPFDRRLKSIQVGPMKLIVSDRGTVELYDLASDAGETRDLAEQQPRVVARLREELAAWSDGWEPASSGLPEPPLADGTLEALRELGYIE